MRKHLNDVSPMRNKLVEVKIFAMLNKISTIFLILVGLINLAPIMVFFSPDKTKRLYGLPIEGENLTILMRHRGVLLALVGLALIYAAFKPRFSYCGDFRGFYQQDRVCIFDL